MPEQRSSLLSAALLVLLSAAFGGCASNPGNAAATTASAAELRTGVGTARTNLQQLAATLYETDQPEGLDGEAWFSTYRKRHRAVRTSAKTLRKEQQTFDESSRLYLEKWDKDLASIQQPELRAASTTRRDLLRTELRANQRQPRNREPGF